MSLPNPIQRIIPLAIFIGGLFAFSSCSEEQKSAKAAPKKANLQVEVYKAIPQAYNNEISTTADLLAFEQVTLMAPITGQVLNIYFNEGSRVKKGAKIIRIYDRNWHAQLIGLKAELSTTQKDYERKKNLMDIGGSTEEEIDKVYASIEQLKSQIQQLELNIELANVTAPFSGVLGMRNFSKGAYLKEGEEITTLTAIDKLKVDFTLPQAYIADLKKGTKVRLLVNSDTLSAEIYAINPLVNAASRTVNLRAVLDQPNDRYIIPGTYAEVLVTTNFINDAILIPSQAVVPEINDQTVYVYTNGSAQRKTVQLGSRTHDMVHIVSGLNPGDTIITSGLLQVKDGMAVTLQNLH